MARIDEIAPDLFRISTFHPMAGCAFNQFLLRDDQPLLFHTGLRAQFPEVAQAVSRVLDPATLRFVAFSHYEADECGSLNDWLTLAPGAEAACGFTAFATSVFDQAARPPRYQYDDDVLETGRHRLRWMHTPHLPHAWDACLAFDETDRWLLCQDLFLTLGETEPRMGADAVDLCRTSLEPFRDGPFAGYYAWTPFTAGQYDRLAALQPRLLLPMHGPAIEGDGAAALARHREIHRDLFGAP